MADNTQIPSEPPTLRMDRFWTYIAPIYGGIVLLFALYVLMTTHGFSATPSPSRVIPDVLRLLRLSKNANSPRP